MREGALPAYDGRDAGSERRRGLLSRLRGRREQPAPAQEAPSLREELDRKSWVDAAKQAPVQVREPRHVRAIPTSVEHKVSSAIDAFNASEHTRTVAGVARALGAPTVAVQPVDARPGLVNLVLSWELCWYRYEVDLSDDQPGVRLVGQGYELDELPAQERQANAVSDETGALALRE